MKKVIYTLALLFASQSVFAEVAVIVHPSNASSISEAEVARIFTGKMKSFPGGGQAIPINLSSNSPSTNEFNEKALNKSNSQLKAYWSKLVFTGKGTPPKEVDSDAEMLSLISNNPSFIGYIDSSAVTDAVKVVAKF